MVLCTTIVMVNCIVLNCNYGLKVDYDRGRSLYGCEAEMVSTGTGPDIIYVSDRHDPGMGNDDVLILIFTNSLQLTPLGISNFFPNLKVLSFKNIGSPELTNEHLKGLNNLENLDFGDNNLRIIEPNVFNETRLLQIIRFNNNPIRHIAHNEFSDLEELTFLEMSSTACIDSNATKPVELDILLFRLFIDCPPTFEMTEEKIVNGDLLRSNVQAQIAEETNPILKMLKRIKKEQEKLDERVTILENFKPRNP